MHINVAKEHATKCVGWRMTKGVHRTYENYYYLIAPGDTRLEWKKITQPAFHKLLLLVLQLWSGGCCCRCCYCLYITKCRSSLSMLLPLLRCVDYVTPTNGMSWWLVHFAWCGIAQHSTAPSAVSIPIWTRGRVVRQPIYAFHGKMETAFTLATPIIIIITILSVCLLWSDSARLWNSRTWAINWS